METAVRSPDAAVGAQCDSHRYGSNLGYARVSTSCQDLKMQLATFAVADVDDDRIYTDELSGAAKTSQPGLAALLD